MVVDPSSLRPWYEQLVQHLRAGRLRYLQRIAVVCAALEPRPPLHSPLSANTQPPQQELDFIQSHVVQKHDRLYIPNPFLLPNLHNCVLCVRKRSLTTKRILAALGAGDLSSVLDRDDVPSGVGLIPFLLSCIYVNLINAKGAAAAEIENTLQKSVQSKLLSKYSFLTPPVTYAALVTAIINRTLRFIEPSPSESPLPPFETTPLSLYFNELFETVFLERWTTLHTAKALIESLQGAVEKSISVELKFGKDQKIPPATSQEAWDEHISTCFDLVYEYQYRSPNIVISQLRHLYQLHHAASLRKGPRGYRGWWETDRMRRLALLMQILQHTTNDLSNTTCIDIIKFIFLLLVGWAHQLQPHEIAQSLHRKQNKDPLLHSTFLPLDEEDARLVVEATEYAKRVLALRDSNFGPSLVFLLLSVGVLIPFASQYENTTEYVIGLLYDDLWAEFITNHPRLPDVSIPLANFLAALRAPSSLRAATKAILILWRNVLPTFNDGLLVHTIFKVAASNVSQSALSAQELETWYTVVSSLIQESFGASHHDSVHWTSLYAASGVLKGLPATTQPQVYTVLQEVLMTALHRLNIEPETVDLWKSAVAFALAHSGLCSKNTTLDVDHDVPKALDLLVQTIVQDVFGGWIFGFAPSLVSSNEPDHHNFVGLDIHTTPVRAHAHAKTAHYSSSSAFTSSIARLFIALPLDHPTRDTTIHYLWSYAKLVYDSWREIIHRTEASYTDSSVVTASLLPIVQLAQLSVTLFCFYTAQTSAALQKSQEATTDSPSNLQAETHNQLRQPTGIDSRHAVDAVDALSYLEFAGADVPRFYSKLANLFLSDQVNIEKNLKELIYRIPIPSYAYASFNTNRDLATQSHPQTKDGKALLARVAFLLRVVEPLAPLVDVDTLTNRLIPVAFALLSHASEQVRRSAHAVIHSLLTLAPVPLAQSLVPSYCRIALASALVDDIPVPSSSSNSQIADYLYESMAAIFRRMSPPVALIAVRALASAATSSVASSSDGTQHKKLILLLLAQTVIQVDISILDITLAEISKIIQMATPENKHTLLTFLHRVVTRNVDYTRKTHLASWFLLQVKDAKLD